MDASPSARPRVLLVDNSLGRGTLTPQLRDMLARRAEVHVASSRAQMRALERLHHVWHGVILSGSDALLTEGVPQGVFAMNAAALALRVPVLGICFGMQILAVLRGGVVARLTRPMVGTIPVVVDARAHLLAPGRVRVHHKNLDAIRRLPPRFIAVAHGQDGVCVAMQHTTLPLYGVQFHPEGSPPLPMVLRSFLARCTATVGGTRSARRSRK